MKRPVVIVLLIVALALACVGIGSVVFFTLRRADFGFLNVPLVSAMVEESKTLTIDPEKPVTLKVDNDAGEVSVVGGDVQKVEVKIIKTGNATTEAGAQEHLEAMQYDITQNGNTLTLTYKLDGAQTREVDTVDFIVTVPTETTVDIENSLGAVVVSDLNGDVDISSSFGDVTVSNIEGALELDNSSGEIEITNVNAGTLNVLIEADFGGITLEKVNGRDITVDSNSGTLTLTDVRATGELDLGSDFGNLTFENGSAASVTVDSNSGRVELTKLTIRGKLVITCDFGDIELNQVSADSYDLDSNSGAITVNGVKNEVKAHTDFGNITIENAEEVTLDLRTNSGAIEFSGTLGAGPHNVQSDFGSITLAIPADSALDVDFTTDFGSISSDIPVTVTLDGSEKNHQEGTMNGGGAQLTVQTNNGPINITAIK